MNTPRNTIKTHQGRQSKSGQKGAAPKGEKPSNNNPLRDFALDETLPLLNKRNSTFLRLYTIEGGDLNSSRFQKGK